MKKIHCAGIAVAAVLALGCLGCQPQSPEAAAPSPAEDDNATTAVEVAWTPETDCATCHNVEESQKTTHHANMTCSNCHSDEEALATVHAEVTSSDKMPKKLKATEVSEETCSGCHDSYEELAATTADSTVLTDKNGTTVNPHAFKDLGVQDHEDLNCADCHAEHSGKEITEEAMNTCTGCHHQDVFECGTCHV